MKFTIGGLKQVFEWSQKPFNSNQLKNIASGVLEKDSCISAKIELFIKKD